MTELKILFSSHHFSHDCSSLIEIVFESNCEIHLDVNSIPQFILKFTNYSIYSLLPTSRRQVSLVKVVLVFQHVSDHFWPQEKFQGLVQ